uniref:Aminoglycoside phosphotransferase domain-containing protein n=1 Tax=Thermosporothrix sp. COM3 TaxID=2490863 RepID=A0A455SHX5_9CHLR|nr:hypothetical protein KTC_12530 [Thermosporothrix sp. COM3]
MKQPLPEGNELIRSILREYWQLEPIDLHFIPIGDSAYSYRVEADSTTYLKIVDRRTATGRRTAERMQFSLPLQRTIASMHLEALDAPLPLPTTSGTLQADTGPLLFALYTFIPGETLANAYPMSRELVGQIGRALAQLHTVRPPEGLHVPPDDLTAPFDQELRENLAALDAITTASPPFLQQLRALVEPRRTQIDAFLEQSDAYAEKARQKPTHRVLCHGDPWGGNIIRTSSQRLTFLDWEAAIIAPPERDAYLYSGFIKPDFSAFAAAYEAPFQWNMALLAYYTYRLQLRNLAAWLHSLLHEPLNEVQRLNNLDMIENHCFDRLESVEQTARALIAQQ